MAADLDRIGFLEKCDASLLSPDMSEKKVVETFKTWCELPPRGIVVHSSSLKLLKGLDETPTVISVVVGFPLGLGSLHMKVLETLEAMTQGAGEVDVVLNPRAIRENRFDLLEKEIKEITTKAPELIPKFIIEISRFPDRIHLAKVVKRLPAMGAKWLKTSTGFGPPGDAAEMTGWLRSVVGKKTKIKAAGGIRTLADVKACLKAGADLVGTSSVNEILQELG